MIRVFIASVMLLGLSSVYAQTPSKFELLVDGKTTVDSTSKFKLVQIRSKESKGVVPLANYQWVISIKGQNTIYKGLYPEQRSKLLEIAGRLKTGDILFIEPIKTQGSKPTFYEQFAIVVQ